MSPSLRFDDFDARLQIREARVHIPHLLDAFYGTDPSDLSDADVLCFLLVATGKMPELDLPDGVEIAAFVRDAHP